jgi:flagellar protein FliO/FliZ
MTLDADTWAKALVALAAVLAMLWVAAQLLRIRALPRRGARRLSVEDVIAVDPRRRLLVVRCDGRDALLLTGGTQDVMLGWLPGPGAP